MSELHYLTATELARLIKTRQVSAVEVLQAHLDRIEEVNPRLNAIVTLAAERALDAARAADATLSEVARSGAARSGAARSGAARSGSCPWGRCTACRWRTRTWSTRPGSAPRTGRRCSPSTSPTRTT
ncbi:hypothetical protein ACFQYP_29870 [Nonomuraea antimicrobica]